MKKIYLKIFLISIIISFVFCIKSYCAEDGTLRMQINNGTRWTNITIGDAYEECEALNSSSSTLGTSALKAHLTTDFDYSAVGIFSAAQYGVGSLGQYGGITTGNNSGVYLGGNTTPVYSTTVGKADKYNDWILKLFDSNGNPRKYVNVLDKTTMTDQNGRKIISLIPMLDGGTSGLAGENTEGFVANAIAIKWKLFSNQMRQAMNPACAGSGSPTTSFRPVIWN